MKKGNQEVTTYSHIIITRNHLLYRRDKSQSVKGKLHLF